MTTAEGATVTAPSPTSRNFYLGLWARLPRELLLIFLAFPIATVGFGLSIGLFNAGIGTLPVFLVGVFVIIAVLYVSRGFGMLNILMLDFSGLPVIERADWKDAQAGTGFWPWFRAVLLNGHYWLALIHTMLVNFVLSLITWVITVVWISVGFGGITFWAWGRLQSSPDPWYLSRWLFSLPSVIDPRVADTVLYFFIGLIALATLPFLTRGFAWAHWGAAKLLLGAWPSEALARQVQTLSEARGAASSAEGHSLRRLERDIHDGPQQRLVRMQMDLAAADRQLDEDPAKARALIAEAMQQSKDALDELRALSRGFAPPILLDRGLVAALESAATRSPIPAHVVNDVPEGTNLPQEMERNAYFVASEALTNAAKHSKASTIEVKVAITRVEASGENWLTVSVTDDGVGGAVTSEGHGLAGLDERMRGLGGSLVLTSPAGGPTIVSGYLPLPGIESALP
ncbi:MAG TPA: sensor domain-containing protein [Galbitalea sp.]